MAFWVDPAGTPAMSAWRPWALGMRCAIWVQAVAALPWVILLAGQGLCWVERELEEDAALAAGPWRVFRHVTLRRSLAAVGAALLWVAVQTGGEVTVTDTMQVRTYAEEVYSQYVRPEPDDTATTAEALQARAVAVSVPALAVTGALLLAAALWWERNLPPLETLTDPSPRPYRLGWARWPCLAAVLLVAGVLLGVPLASLVYKAGWGGSPPHWSAATALFYVRANPEARGEVIAGNVGFGLATGAVTGALALAACWLAVGSRWFRAGLLVLVVTAWALPGPVVGLGLKSACLALTDVGPPAVGRWLYHGPSYLPVAWACLVRYFPCAVALLWPVVRLVPPELRDAARVDGAGPVQEFRHLVWPLTGLAWVRAAWAVAILSLGELGASKLVSTPGAPTLAHEIFNKMHYGVTNDLAGLCLVLLAFVAAGGAVVAGLGRILGHLQAGKGRRDR
jgi:iron(III) transport system permease protein